MRRIPVFVGVLLIMLALSSGSSYGQGTSETKLSELLASVFLRHVVLARTPAGGGVQVHDPVFATDPTVTAVLALVSQVNQQIGSQLSLFPLGSSAGGFTYRFDPAIGTFSRSTDSFGPAFAERAVTVGRKKLNFGTNYVRATYDTLEGKDLGNGDLKVYLLHQRLTPPSFVEGDVVEAAFKMKLTNDTVVFFANYGVTDQVDVGIAIPVVRVNMDLTYAATIKDYATGRVDPTRHRFANGAKSQDFPAQATATGIGDVVLRAKYNFLKGPGGGLAAAVDLRLPSGDDSNLLGAGTTQGKVFLIASTTAGKVSPHGNVGYTFSGEGEAFPVTDQVNFSGGLEFAPTPRLTIVGDVIGRTLRDAFRLKDATPLNHTFRQGDTAPLETVTLPQLGTSRGNLSSALAAVGVKVNPWQNLLISAHVLVSLNKAGLRDRVTPLIGFDYAF